MEQYFIPIRLAGHVADVVGEERRGVYRVFVGKPVEKRALGHTCDGNNVDFQEVGWGALIGLMWLRIGGGLL